MAQWLMAPHFLCERRHRRYERGETAFQVDYQVTYIVVTNPTPQTGRLGLNFYEARGDGSFALADWAGGTLRVRPKKQVVHQPTPPEDLYDGSFWRYGWFEIWMSLDEMAIEVSVRGISRNLVSGGQGGGGGVVTTRSDRVIDLKRRRAPLRSIVTGAFTSNPDYPSEYRHREEMTTGNLADIDLELSNGSG